MWQPRIKNQKNPKTILLLLLHLFLPNCYCLSSQLGIKYCIRIITVMLLSQQLLQSNHDIFMSGFDGGFPFPLNNYGKSISRLPKKSFNANTDSSISTKPSVIEPTESTIKVDSRVKETPNVLSALNKISDLSPSPVFQDMDRSQKSISRSGVRQVKQAQKKQETKVVVQKPSLNPLGLITGVYMQTTTKFTKIKPEQNLRTPIKNILVRQEQTPDNSRSSSKVGAGKFARKRVDNSSKVEKIQDLVLNTNTQQVSSSHQALGTDRSSSHIQGKKIQRKAEKPKRQLKFHDKKDNKVDDDKSQSSRQPSPQNVIKTIQKNSEQKSSQKLESVSASKPYQPLQRQNRTVNRPQIPTNTVSNDKISESEQKPIESSPIQQFDDKNKQSNISIVKPYQRKQTQSQKFSQVETPISTTKLQEAKSNQKPEQKPPKMVESKMEGLITSSALKPYQKSRAQTDRLLDSQSELSSSSVTPYPNLKPTESVYESHIQASVVRPYQRPQLKVPDIVNQIIPSPISSNSSLSSSRQRQPKHVPKQVQPESAVKNSQFSQMQAILGGQSVVKSDSIKQSQVIPNNETKSISRSRLPASKQVVTPSKVQNSTPIKVEQTKVQEPSKTGDISNKRAQQKTVPLKTPTQSFRSSNQSLVSSNILGEEVKISLRKSSLISLIIKRLLGAQLQSSFKLIKQISSYYKFHGSCKGKPLIYGSEIISKCKQINLVRHSFEQMKKKFTSPYIASLKGEVQWKQTNTKQVSFNLIDKLYLSKLRAIFNKLIAKKLWATNQIKSFDTFHKFQRNKNSSIVRNALLLILHRSKQKYSLVSTVINIANSTNKQKVTTAFISLLKAKRKEEELGSTPQKKIEKPSLKQSAPASPIQQHQSVVELGPNPLLLQKVQKLKSIINSVNEGFSILNNKFQSLKAQKQHQKQQFKARVDELHQANEQMQGQLQNKKNRHTVLERQLTTIQTRTQRKHQISDEIETEDTHLQLLTKIYIGNFKNKEQTVLVQDLWEEYQLNSYSNSAKTILQWQALQQNIQIKRIIASYQHLQMSTDFKARRVALAEQQIVTKLAKSYLKEQYFWEWLHLSAETI